MSAGPSKSPAEQFHVRYFDWTGTDLAERKNLLVATGQQIGLTQTEAEQRAEAFVHNDHRTLTLVGILGGRVVGSFAGYSEEVSENTPGIAKPLEAMSPKAERWWAASDEVPLWRVYEWAVDPALQRQGLGGQLALRGLRAMDRDYSVSLITFRLEQGIEATHLRRQTSRTWICSNAG